jgi:hypothetical protein
LWVFLLSIGSVYAGKNLMGLFIFVVYIKLIAIYYMLGMNIILSILALLVWIYGLYDAYTTAKATTA